ncbi:MAG TPA: uroporphyrinogen-III synthase [Anaerolineales bacterium]|nr:uroporphyrinogen-III synthase [Anaerolineales bacterium]
MKRILITRPRAQTQGFAERLRAAGFEPIFFPVIEICPIENNVALERALSKLDCYDWIIFTSVNAVDVVFNNPPLPRFSLPESGRDGGVKVAAIGPKTAEALQARGVVPDFVPGEYVAEAIVPGLGDLRGKWVLLPRAEIARRALPEAIFEAGGIPHEITTYKTLPVQPDSEGLAALKSGVDIVTLTSPSTAQNFVAIVRQNGFDPLQLPGNPLFACIGPITEQAAREEGLVNLVVAKEYTTDGLIAVISNLEVS